jgi:hypothetical protein
LLAFKSLPSLRDNHGPMANLVISYAHTDRPLVRGVVALLKAAYGKTVDKTVFWDEDFEPGENWFQQFHDEIDRAPELFVFWCNHSAQSSAVRQEFLYAIQQKKRVIPVLLDDTVLAQELAPIEGVDLRESVFHQRPPSVDDAIGHAIGGGGRGFPAGIPLEPHVTSSKATAVIDAFKSYLEPLSA